MTAPSFDNLANLYARPGFLLRRTHQISTAVFEDECRSIGLTPAQFGVLSVLRASPGLDQSTLGRALGFDKVTVLRVLRGLESRQLIQRAPRRPAVAIYQFRCQPAGWSCCSRRSSLPSARTTG